MMKRVAMSILAVLLLAGAAVADGPQGQFKSANRYATATGTDTATATITGVSGKSVRIYKITVVCYDTNSDRVPTARIKDGGNVVWAVPHRIYSNVTYPVGIYDFNPPWTVTEGNTADVLANYGAACSGGTELMVQADQF